MLEDAGGGDMPVFIGVGIERPPFGLARQRCWGGMHPRVDLLQQVLLPREALKLPGAKRDQNGKGDQGDAAGERQREP